MTGGIINAYIFVADNVHGSDFNYIHFRQVI